MLRTFQGAQHRRHVFEHGADRFGLADQPIPVLVTSHAHGAVVTTGRGHRSYREPTAAQTPAMRDPTLDVPDATRG